MIDAVDLLLRGQGDQPVPMLDRDALAVRPPCDGVIVDAKGRPNCGGTSQGRDYVLDRDHVPHSDGYLPSSQVDIWHATRCRLSDDTRGMPREPRPPAYSAIQQKVGERIRWARELVVPNRAELARMMGVDRTTLQKIEDGDRPPSIFNVLDLAHRLRVTPDYILTGSMRGVDGEIAALLVSQHPELARTRMGTVDDTPLPPRKPGKRAA